MEEASPLKSRQYLALGLPMIIGYNDTDISNDKEYILDIGNYQNNIEDNIDKIKLFIKSVKGFNADAIIQDAKEILDYKNKEKSRVKYLENLK